MLGLWILVGDQQLLLYLKMGCRPPDGAFQSSRFYSQAHIPLAPLYIFRIMVTFIGKVEYGLVSKRVTVDPYAFAMPQYSRGLLVSFS